jgi:hypothetical protein
VGFLTRTRDKNYWESKNLILGQGEIGFEDGTGKYKIGDGHSRWNDLSYSSLSTFSFTEEEPLVSPVDVSDDIAKIHDTDAEREAFVPARLSEAALRAAFGRPTSTDGTNSLPVPTGVGLEFVITAAGLQDIRFNGTSL